MGSEIVWSDCRGGDYGSEKTTYGVNADDMTVFVVRLLESPGHTRYSATRPSSSDEYVNFSR